MTWMTDCISIKRNFNVVQWWMGDVKYQTEEGSEGYSLTVADKEILSNYTQCTNFIQIRFYPAFPIFDITKGAWG